MKFTRLSIPDVVAIEPKYHGDRRGYFSEIFRKDLLDEFLGYKVNFIQDNESFSSFGTLRGLHYQLPPFSQSKLVRVVEGEVLDVAVDLRSGSPTFGHHVSIILSSENKKQLFVPKGFAHGFVVLSETCKFFYKVDNTYSPECERGIKFDDEKLKIDWRLGKDSLILSNKDISLPSYIDAEVFDKGVKLYD